MRHLPSFAAIAALSCFAAAPVSAQELIAVDFQGQAFGVDSVTGQGRTIGATGVGSCNAMALHDGQLYATAQIGVIGPRQLVRIDPITAQATVLFPNLSVDLRGLTSRIGTNELYGLANGTPDQLVRIDLTTGQITTVGSTGLTGIQSLESRSSASFLFAWDGTLGLVRIAEATGAVTDVNTSVGTQGVDIQFLTTVFENDVPRLIGGRSGLFEIDRFTGVVTTIVGTGLGDLRGAEPHSGRTTGFGVGCQAAATAQATLQAKGSAMPGTTMQFFSNDHAAGAIGLFVLGLSNTVHQGVPLPVDLDPVLGTVGCDLLVGPDLLLLAQANGLGRFGLTFTMPAVFGGVVHFQLAALEPVPGGMSFTNGVSVQMPQ